MIPYDQIRSHYEYLTPKIIERSAKHPKGWVSPYCDINWNYIFSPIEKTTWHALREFGHAPFYPQYPVDRFFVDFGNPALKIAIECDGRQFHLDKEKDGKRDERLHELGWKVYRIPGRDCLRPVSEEYHWLSYKRKESWHRILSEFYIGTIEGLIKALAIEYFRYKTYCVDKYVDELEIVKSCLWQRRSRRQRFIEYKLNKSID